MDTLFWAMVVLSAVAGIAAEPAPSPMVRLFLVAGGTLTLIAMVVFQIMLRRYRPVPYWITVVMTSLVGASVANSLGPALAASLGGGLLLLGLIAWLLFERPSSALEVRTVRQESVYWVVVFAALVLGTGMRQLLSVTAHLGSLSSSIVFAAVVALSVIAYSFFRVPASAAFWWAFVGVIPLAGAVAELIAIAAGGAAAAKLTVGLLALVALAVLVVIDSGRNRRRAARGM
ncbi:hypothetical protein GCM10010988_40980 [Cnuibacter physcomitrellae]|uniref:Uncharacterized protein n=1 Tax=Cnuibacter physcomitrellae TaxID=1619308 RepID=A0A1X9LQX5_9MICO|nr:hypothetical protein B5808_19625 [Cnuibacter physcomitrellae]GGI42824.1 hypothetical protein GCM10010988_40980 [Cnuibacter physcomitrellae]